MAYATHRSHACLTKALMGSEDSLSLRPQPIAHLCQTGLLGGTSKCAKDPLGQVEGNTRKQVVANGAPHLCLVLVSFLPLCFGSAFSTGSVFKAVPISGSDQPSLFTFFDLPPLLTAWADGKEQGRGGNREKG